MRELAVVDLMILRREQRAGDLAGKTRLARARRRGRQPFERQTELALKLQMMRNRRLIVGSERQHQRALAAQFDVDAAHALKLLGKGRPARLALAAERDQSLFAGLGFATGRQHAGRRVACARSGLAAVEHRDRGAAGEPPGNAEPDHAGADNDDARLVSDRCDGGNSVAQRGSLRWYDPDRFDGCDLSRAYGAAPLADALMMVIFAAADKRRFPRRYLSPPPRLPP